MYENITPETARALRASAGDVCALSDFMRGVSAPQQAAYRDVLARVGICDTLLLGYPDGDGGWITFAAIADKPIRTFPGQRTIWRRVAAHLATAWRLRTRIGTARAAAEAMISPSGRVISAEGTAAESRNRDRLSHAAKNIDRARSSLRRRDPMAAMDLWKGLVSGRWSLIDRVDTRGARVLIAHQNDPQTPDPRSLSPRERAIVELVMTGASNKHIAYTLGLGAGTVGAHLQQALGKLGISSRVELVRLAMASAGADAWRAAVGDAELGVLVVGAETEDEHLPLTIAERDVARLVADGLTNAEIAGRRGSSERTIANQIAAIYEKLGIGSRPELVVALMRRGKAAETSAPTR